MGVWCGHVYWIHRYEGALNGIDKAVVLLSYPKDAFGDKKVLCMFICSDLSLSDREILSHYTHRWKIEVMFKQQKMYMGLKSFMVRPAKAIEVCHLALGAFVLYHPFRRLPVFVCRYSSL